MVDLLIGGKGKQLSDRPTEKYYEKCNLVFQFLNMIGGHDLWGKGELTVTTNLDVIDPHDGVLSLREALLFGGRNANISFANELSGQSIVLNVTELTATRPVRIDADGHDITIDGNNKGTILHTDGLIQENETTTIVGLTFTGGASSCAIRITHATSLISVRIVDNISTTVLRGGFFVLHNSIIAGNDCVRVIENWGSSFVVNCLIYNNTGMVVENWGQIDFVNSTATSNGSGIQTKTIHELVNARAYIRNSIVAGNGTEDAKADEGTNRLADDRIIVEAGNGNQMEMSVDEFTKLDRKSITAMLT